MDTLNDDCQLIIIKYLSLVDQLKLYEATKEPKNRLSSNVCYTWQHQIRFSLDAEFFKHFDEKPELLYDFLSSMSPTLEQLDLQFVTLNNLKLLTPYNYPKMRSLKYTVDDDDMCNDYAFQILIVELFPELTELTMHGDINFNYLKNLTHLRKLDISDCSISSLISIPVITELEMLEELNISYQLLNEVSTLMCLPKLRIITSQFGCKHDVLSEMRVKDIHKIIFNDSIWEFSLPALQTLTNLRQLTLLEDDGFTSEQLQELITGLPQLERLDLINFTLWGSEIELWQTVASCPPLRILNISRMQLYADFFEIGRRHMEKVLDNRSTFLSLHCYDTGPHENLVSRNRLFLLWVLIHICLCRFDYISRIQS